jgi:hypothetical protein
LTLTAGQIYAPTATTFTIGVYDSMTGAQDGQLTVQRSGDSQHPLPSPQSPLSAGSTLNLYAANIAQDGVLRAPLGTINLGSDGSIADPVAGAKFAAAGALSLGKASITSVSAADGAMLDPATDQPVAIPYGVDVDGTTWIDPRGVDITTQPPPGKNITLSAAQIETDSGSKLDLSGGGDLFSYRWVSGVGGTKDILDAESARGSFAVVPGYTSDFAPYGAYNSAGGSVITAQGGSTANVLAGSDLGYVSVDPGTGKSRLAVGDSVHLQASMGLPEGDYVLLPSRYALLPGAFLVTPMNGVPAGAATVQPDHSSLVAGYRFSAFARPAGEARPLYTSFEVADATVIAARAQYDPITADKFFGSSDGSATTTARLPVDAGQLVFAASQRLALRGSLSVLAPESGRGGLVDLNSPGDIFIVGAGAVTDTLSGLVLNAQDLGDIGAASLLIGGRREESSNGVTVTPSSDRVIVDNQGTPLHGSDIILVAKALIDVRDGSEIDAAGAVAGATDPVTVGDAAVARSGNGALLRVSNDPAAQAGRIANDESTGHDLSVGAATLKGAGVVLDSSGATTLSPNATLTADALSFGSQRVSVDFAGVIKQFPKLVPDPGLVLAGDVLAGLQSVKSLSLVSYSSIDFYGPGTLGSAGTNSLALRAPALRGFDTGANGTILTGSIGTVALAAGTIVLDNGSGGNAPASLAGFVSTGVLGLDADTVRIDSTPVQTAAATWQYAPQKIWQFGTVFLNAAKGIVFQTTPVPSETGNPTVTGQESAGLTTAVAPGQIAPITNLRVKTPVITATDLTNTTLDFSSGAVTIEKPAAGDPAAAAGLGATLRLLGASIVDNGLILMPSGSVSLVANGTATGNRDIVVGGTIDVAGQAKAFNDVTRSTDGGDVTLSSAHGSVILASGSTGTVAGGPGSARAGSLTVIAPEGALSLAGTLHAEGGVDQKGGADGAQGGSFSLDVGALPSTKDLDAALNAAGFVNERSIRVRTGNVSVDGLAVAHRYALSADQGDITVAAGGSIDANGHAVDAAGAVVDADLKAKLDNKIWAFDATGAVIDVASGETVLLQGGRGGSIDLAAWGSVALQSGGKLSAAGTFFDAAGKGGAVSLATRGGETLRVDAEGNDILDAQGHYTYRYDLNKVIDIQPESTIDLSVRAQATRADQFTGTLHLRAPQITDDATGDPVGVQINPIPKTANLVGASSVVVEGIKVFDLTPTDPTQNDAMIDSTVQQAVQANGAAFAGGYVYATDANGNYIYATDANGNLLYDGSGNLVKTTAKVEGRGSDIVTKLTAGWTSVDPELLHVEPGAEVINRTGGLTLNTTWDFAAGATIKLDAAGAQVLDSLTGLPQWDTSKLLYRYGWKSSGESKQDPGILTLRAKGNLAFGFDANAYSFGSLSDGFVGFDGQSNSSLWMATLLPGGIKSWTYRLVAGADMSAADVLQVRPVDQLSGGTGSLQLGVGVGALSTRPVVNDTGYIVSSFFQTIRTGTGNIEIAAGRDVQLLNPLGTIYTAGSQASSLADFDNPISTDSLGNLTEAQYSFGGGNVTIQAQGDIAHLVADNWGDLVADSSREMPFNWLYRRSWIDPKTGQFGSAKADGEIDSTSWWIDFSNFFEGVGALGGGNVTLVAGHDVSNVDAVVPTNARMPKSGTPDAAKLVELGGGDLRVEAGNDIDGGVYYVERGQGTLAAGNSIHSNPTRSIYTGAGSAQDQPKSQEPASWLPTTLYVGQAGFAVSARGDLLLGPVVNPFLLPQGTGNQAFYQTLFSTYNPESAVTVFSLGGSLTLKDSSSSSPFGLSGWFANSQSYATESQPWLSWINGSGGGLDAGFNLMPANLHATAYSGDLNLAGGLTLAPAPQGTVELLAAGALNGTQPYSSSGGLDSWVQSTVNLSDADPGRIPSPASPLSFPTPYEYRVWERGMPIDGLTELFQESGSSEGVLQTKQALHAPGPLHAQDSEPVRIYAEDDISGLTVFSGKPARIVAGNDITDIAFYLQNTRESDVSVVVAGRDVIPYDPTSPLRQLAQNASNLGALTSLAGDIQIGGPGSLEVIAGRNFDLGSGPNQNDGTGVGVTSIGYARNPSLPFGGADLVLLAGVGAGGTSAGQSGLGGTTLGFADILAKLLDPASAGAEAARYLPELATARGLLDDMGNVTDLGVGAGLTEINRNDPVSLWTALTRAPANEVSVARTDRLDRLALDGFFLALRDAGRDYNDPDRPGYRKYDDGVAAIKALFPGSRWSGDMVLTSREIKTDEGGAITLLAPGGQIYFGVDTSDNSVADQGILTVYGGDISIFARNSVSLGTSRIFTLRGGNIVIWSDTGNIAAGASPKTVQSAPPTRVLIDAQSADLRTDLAGLRTGGGIGVLATVAGVPPGDVDLIAPTGTIDAGDAGIRVTGNINLAAVQVLNSTNIQAGGASAGVPVATAPSMAGVATAAASSSASMNAAATATAKSASNDSVRTVQETAPSLITVEVLGYGGGEGGDEEKRSDDEDRSAERKRSEGDTKSEDAGARG